MFMNKISMSQTCLKLRTRFLQQPVATEGIRYLYGIAAGPHDEFLKNFFQFAIVCFQCH